MNRFAQLRQEAGLTVDEIVADFGSPSNIVCAWEAGTTQPPAHVVRTLEFLRSGSGTVTASIGAELNPGDIAPQQWDFEWMQSTPAKGPRPSNRESRTGAFVDNMKLPVHRWFRYSAGFSAEWVSRIIESRRERLETQIVFDPFAGSGTTLLSAQDAGIRSAGAERHPFVHRIATAKLCWNTDIRLLRKCGAETLKRASDINPPPLAEVPDLLRKCYSPEALERLESLRIAYSELAESNCSNLIWLALTSIVRECSGVGTAQWQYVLPNKTKARVADPFTAFERRIEMFCSDMSAVQRRNASTAPAHVTDDDARTLVSTAHLLDQVGLIVTSPPYPNNYDYADATRLEMTFWREIESWSDLHQSVRNRLVRSCSQHTAAERLVLDDLLGSATLDPIKDELTAVCQRLEEVRETKGGRKTYHTMVAAYFADMADVWTALRPLCAADAEVCFVIGDSAPYGVHVPADRWMLELAVAAGFRDPRFEKIRDRNLKWKNRKHRVPLQEGNLWLRA